MNTSAPVDVYLQDEAPEEFHIGHYNKQSVEQYITQETLYNIHSK